MKESQPQMGNHAPQPPHSTDKTCYQGRMGITPTRTPKLAFPNINEGPERMLQRGYVENYSPINGREPTSMERGIAGDQGSMGSMNNSFKDNI